MLLWCARAWRRDARILAVGHFLLPSPQPLTFFFWLFWSN